MSENKTATVSARVLEPAWIFVLDRIARLGPDPDQHDVAQIADAMVKAVTEFRTALGDCIEYPGHGLTRFLDSYLKTGLGSPFTPSYSEAGEGE